MNTEIRRAPAGDDVAGPDSGASAPDSALSDAGVDGPPSPAGVASSDDFRSNRLGDFYWYGIGDKDFDWISTPQWDLNETPTVPECLLNIFFELRYLVDAVRQLVGVGAVGELISHEVSSRVGADVGPSAPEPTLGGGRDKGDVLSVEPLFDACSGAASVVPEPQPILPEAGL